MNKFTLGQEVVHKLIKKKFKVTGIVKDKYLVTDGDNYSSFSERDLVTLKDYVKGEPTAYLDGEPIYIKE